MRQISATYLPFLMLLLNILGTVENAAQPDSKTYRISQHGSAAPGYFLISPAKSDTLGVIDNAGKAVFPINVGMQINLQAYKNRELSYFGVTSNGGILGFASYVRMNSNQQITDSILLVGPYQADFHEGFPTSDTTFMILGTYRVPTDLSNFVAGGFTDAEIIGNIIQEVSRSGRVLFEWKSLDHIPYQDATEDIDFAQSLVDVMHINSIFQDTDGGLIISCRHLDEIIKINRTTGEVVWRLGGSKSKNNQFRFLNDTVGGFYGFSHQHSAMRTSRGTLLLFDNGNLKPSPQKSRIVEYELDEVKKTARKVFEYSPKVDVFASTMGSASELPNGNILIGYGSAAMLQGGFSDIAAEEIDRNSKVVGTVYNLPVPRINAYRIGKSTYGMSGIQRTVSQVGSVEFADIDSTTRVLLNVSRVNKSTAVTVEKHHYAPRILDESQAGRYAFPPVRWGIRIDDTTSLSGTMKMKLGGQRDAEDPSTAVILYRPKEGAGTFTEVKGTYASVDSSWTLPAIKQGEYAIAYTSRLYPELISPSNLSVNVKERPLLRWHKLLFASAYDVQIARDSAFTRDLFTTSTVDTILQLSTLRNNTSYWWRIRKRTSRGVAAWSNPWRFTTEFNAPRIVAPDTAKAMPFVDRNSLFRWTSVQGASVYNVVVHDTAMQPVYDTLVADTVLIPVARLTTNMRLLWTVRARIDSAFSPASASKAFATAPQQPSLVLPEPNVMIAPQQGVDFRWSGVQDIATYRFVLTRRSGSEVVVDTTVEGVAFKVNELKTGEEYDWSCQSIGRYGLSLPSTQRFAIAERQTLLRPVIAADVQRRGLSSTQTSSCVWLPVESATTYHIQAARSVVFDAPAFDSVVDRTHCDVLFSQPSSLYAWRVQARNGYDISPWSDTVYVSTSVDSSAVLLPTYPIHGTVNAKTDDWFRFVGGHGFTGYEVQLARDPGFVNIDFKYYCFSDSTEYAFLERGIRYFWRVKGFRGGDTSFFGQVATMVVDDAVNVHQEDDSQPDLRMTTQEDGSISLINIGIDEIEGVRVYDVLGQCVQVVSKLDVARPLQLTPGTQIPRFIVVTFSSGKTYFMRAR